jgi:short-subunit dehydrogenase
MEGKGVQITIFCPGFIRTEISMNALTESGDKLRKMDDAQANGMPAEECARQMIAALRNGKREVYIGGKETLGIYMKRFFPGLMSRIITKAKVR